LLTVAVDGAMGAWLLSITLDLLPPALVARPRHPSSFLQRRSPTRLVCCIVVCGRFMARVWRRVVAVVAVVAVLAVQRPGSRLRPRLAVGAGRAHAGQDADKMLGECNIDRGVGVAAVTAIESPRSGMQNGDNKCALVFDSVGERRCCDD
jgi:hypothetical protein